MTAYTIPEISLACSSIPRDKEKAWFTILHCDYYSVKGFELTRIKRRK
jgi:hypothetical protein